MAKSIDVLMIRKSWLGVIYQQILPGYKNIVCKKPINVGRCKTIVTRGKDGKNRNNNNK